MLGLSDKIREILSSGKMVVSIKESICMKHIHTFVPNKIQLSHFSEKDEKDCLIGTPTRLKTWSSHTQTTGCVMSNSPLDI